MLACRIGVLSVERWRAGRRSTLDDEHGLLNLGFVPGPPRPRRQDGGSAMRRHFGIGPIDLRIVKAGLDDDGVVRHG